MTSLTYKLVEKLVQRDLTDKLKYYIWAGNSKKLRHLVILYSVKTRDTCWPPDLWTQHACTASDPRSIGFISAAVSWCFSSDKTKTCSHVLHHVIKHRNQLPHVWYKEAAFISSLWLTTEVSRECRTQLCGFWGWGVCVYYSKHTLLEPCGLRTFGEFVMCSVKAGEKRCRAAVWWKGSNKCLNVIVGSY